MRDEALQRALDAVDGPANMARLISEQTGKPITVAAVSQWKRCPPARVLQVSRATGDVVAPHELRPDYYEPPAEAPTGAEVAANG